MRILGIDPGYTRVGYGVVEDDQALDYGCLNPKNDLAILHRQILDLIKRHKPQALAIEKLFFSQNTKTAMRVGEARGVVLLAAAQAKLEIAEYSPMEVKIAVTGYGKAEKKQVQQMVKTLLKLDEIPRPDDTADALAVAICHMQSYKFKELTKC